MLTTTTITDFFKRDDLFKDTGSSDHQPAPAALPDISLEFLVSIAKSVGAKSVFEFGSGRSTTALLDAGLEVVSLEDKDYWMDETKKRIVRGQASHRALIQPLSTVWRKGVPFWDWQIEAGLAEYIKAADIVLIDSPYYPPFRESTLISALTLTTNAIIILDDTRVPTLSRFCDRIALQNPTLLHRRVQVGHFFDIFARLDRSEIEIRRSPVEWLKAWRRYLLGKRALTSSPTS